MMNEFTVMCANGAELDDRMWQIRTGKLSKCYGSAGLKLSYQAEAEIVFEPVTVRRIAPLLRKVAQAYQGTYHAQARHLYAVIAFPYLYTTANMGEIFRNRLEVAAALKLAERLSRFDHHVKEIAPAWREVARWNYADNSIEAEDEDKNGNRRTRRIAAPGGDACY